MINKTCLKDISANREILLREEDFAYISPCEQLKGLISNFTITFPNKSIISDGYTVMPHGSVTLVLFHNDAGLHSWLFGPMTKPQKVGEIANQCDAIFIVEFQPAGFCSLTKIDQKELTDKIVPFSVIDSSLDQTMQRVFSTSLSVDELLSEFEKMLISKIRFLYPEELSSAMRDIIQAKGVMSSIEISNHVFYSPRHLNRLFNRYLGMSMKSFSRLVRINNSIQLLNDRDNTLTLVCETLGYYDVSHFVKDFKIVCKITPQKYRTNVSDYYSEIAKF